MFARVASAAAVSLGGIFGAAYTFDEGTQRSVQFWKGVMPIYMRYRYAQYSLKGVDDETSEAAWNELHEVYAPQIVDLTLQLKGFYLKQAQLMSTRDEFIPDAYMRHLKILQDRVPTPFQPGEAKTIVEKSMGLSSIDEVFSEWDDEPIGAASIGQVHRAVLKESGEEVAVKVQYPGIEKKFRADLKTTTAFCKLAMPQHVPGMVEIEKQFLTEFDYVGEAENQAEIRRNLIEEGPFGDRIAIPRVYTDLCTREVLVMEKMRGSTLTGALRRQMAIYASRIGVSVDELEEEHRARLKAPGAHFHSLHEEHWRQRTIRWYMFAADLLRNTGRLLLNCSLGLLSPRFHAPIEWTPSPIDISSILLLLSDVHAHELFVDGTFNGDPHPGNLMLLDDGRLGLIDYGQVKRLTEEERLAYAKVIIALANDDRDAVVQNFMDMGCRTTRNDPDVLFRLAAFWNDRDTDDITMGMNISDFLDWAEAKDPVLRGDLFPSWAVMPARLSVLLRGFGNAFGIRFRTATLWEKYAEDFKRQYELERGGNKYK